MIDYGKLTAKQRAIAGELFVRGDLSFLLHTKQKEMRKFFYENPDKTIMVFNICRQWGKSFLTFCLAVEHAIRHPDSRILFLAPTRAQAKDIISDKVKAILKFAPPHYKIKPWRNEKYTFPNGSEITLLGIDNDPDRARGMSPHLVILDEAAMCSKLEYAISSVILPSFNASNGRLLLVSTPPATAGHPFKQYILDAVKNDAYKCATWRDSPFLDESRVMTQIAPLIPGGIESARFKIEYECDYNVEDKNLRITPWFIATENDAFFDDYERPPLFQPFVGVDFGYTHSCAVVWGYLDYHHGALVIEDEFSAGQLTTTELADIIKEKEMQLWGNRPSHLPVLPLPIRISDNNAPMVVAEFCQTHGLRVMPSLKKQSLGQAGMINRLNESLRDKKIRVHPRCKNLSFELENALWSPGKMTYARKSDTSHYDLLDALKYLNLDVDFTRSPYQNGGYDRTKVFIPAPNKTSVFASRERAFGF